MAVRSAVCDTW